VHARRWFRVAHALELEHILDDDHLLFRLDRE
jgi:hypothetical protein